MLKAIRFRIYPNAKQANLIERTFGCCRVVFNKGIDLRESAYKAGTKAGYNETCAMVTAMKQNEAYAFLSEVDSVALQQALRDLNAAYSNMFQGRAGHPAFRSKRDSRKSYRTLSPTIRIEDGKLRLPKLGLVKIVLTCEVGKIHNITVERTPTGKYFAVINFEFEPKVLPETDTVIGLDVGIKTFYTDSNGHAVENQKHLEKSMRRLKRAQRKLSRRKKGSHNRRKQCRKVAAFHEKIANQRKDFLQKLTTTLIRENQTICVEDLKVKNMMHNHKLAQHISSVSWSSFFRMLDYKAEWYGREIVRVPTFYPSSQTCSCCGYKNTDVRNLAIRKWECPSCHAVYNRDVNAAINILLKGLSMQTV